MDVEPSSSSTPTDSPLLKLPVELLEAIFGEVYAADALCYLPLCKRLHPVQHRQFWRRLVVGGYEQLAALCRRAPSIPGLETNVVELELVMADDFNDERTRVYNLRDWLQDEGQPVDHLPDPDAISDDEQICPTASLVDFIARLSGLRELNLVGVELDLIDAVVGDDEADDPARTSTPRLQRLEVLGVESTDGAMFEGPERTRAWIGWLRKISRLPKLRDLRLAVYDDYPPPPLPDVEFASSSLLSITIGDSYTLYPWDGPVLSQFAPNLERIDVRNTVVLQHVPSTMRELKLMSPLSGDDPQAQSPLDDFLARFNRLERLEVARNSFDSARLLPYLRSLPNFHTLTLGRNTPTTDAFLDALLDGPSRPPHLRRLTLDHVAFSRAGHLVSDTWHLPDDYDATSADLLPNSRWAAPSYPLGASQAGLRAALRLAAAHGIVVDGTALGALEWDEAYRIERRGAVLEWASRTGRWERAREVLGDDVVEVYRRGLEAGRTMAVRAFTARERRGRR